MTANNSPAVRICGLGTFPPRDATLEALRELSDCGTVFSDLADPASFAWLRRTLGPLRRPADAAAVVRAADGDRRVGLAVWGHACHTSPLAREVSRLCARRGVSCRAVPSLSPISAVLARSRLCVGWDRRSIRGIQARALRDMLVRPLSKAGRLPLVVFAERGTSAEWKRLADGLRAVYPTDHPVEIHLPADLEPRRLRLERLAARSLRGALLMLPGCPHA